MTDKQELENFISKNLKGYNFIIVSNRQPYAYNYKGKQIYSQRSIGGLVSALDPAMRVCKGTWIAQGVGSADWAVVDKNNRIKVPPDNPVYTLSLIFLTKDEEDGYYYGYANQSIWPLSHIVYCKPVFNVVHWKYYQIVNKKFAERALQEAKGDKRNSFIWLQDYHLCLCAKYIKEINPEIVVSLFWHIPWPNPEVFRICPQKKEILEGLLANDLLGFHLQYHCHNFLSTVEQELEAKVDWEEMSIVYQGHLTLIRSFPISIDPQETRELSRSKKVEEIMKTIPQQIEPDYQVLGVGIDRIDYTKGIIEKFQAIDRFLEKYPQYQEKFVFVQLGALSRLHIPAYKKYIDDIQDLAEKINWKYRKKHWYPIVLNNSQMEYPVHLAYSRLADVFIVSSLHDGMNLVAKEYITANIDNRGMLVLSQFTGTAREFKEAILINPYDIEGFADAIKDALEIPLDEKKKRIEKMYSTIQEYNIYEWTLKFISALIKVELR